MTTTDRDRQSEMALLEQAGWFRDDATTPLAAVAAPAPTAPAPTAPLAAVAAPPAYRSGGGPWAWICPALACVAIACQALAPLSPLFVAAAFPIALIAFLRSLSATKSAAARVICSVVLASVTIATLGSAEDIVKQLLILAHLTA